MISQPVSGSGLCTIKAGAAEKTGSILCMIQPPSGCPGPVIRLLSAAALGLTGGWCMSSTVMELQQPMQLDLGLPQGCILSCKRCQFHQWFKLFKVLSKGTGGQNRLKCMKIQNLSTVLFHCQSYYNPVVTLIFHLINGASMRSIVKGRWRVDLLMKDENSRTEGVKSDWQQLLLTTRRTSETRLRRQMRGWSKSAEWHHSPPAADNRVIFNENIFLSKLETD